MKQHSRSKIDIIIRLALKIKELYWEFYDELKDFLKKAIRQRKMTHVLKLKEEKTPGEEKKNDVQSAVP